MIVSRSPQLVFGNLSGEGFVKREVSEATSSLLEIETTTGQRINADERNIMKINATTLPCNIRHVKYQGAATHDIGIGDEFLVVGLSVPLNFIDIHVLCGEASRLHGEALSIGQLKGDLWQLRCAEDEFAAHRIHGIEAHGGEEVPGGHLAAVVVADQSVGFVPVEVGGDLPYQSLRFPGAVEVVVEVGHVVAGLVAVGVLPDEAGHVGEFAGCLLRCVEEVVEHLTRLLLAAHQLDEAGDVLHDVPGILQGVAFGVVAAHAGVGMCQCIGIEGG